MSARGHRKMRNPAGRNSGKMKTEAAAEQEWSVHTAPIVRRRTAAVLSAFDQQDRHIIYICPCHHGKDKAIDPVQRRIGIIILQHGMNGNTLPL